MRYTTLDLRVDRVRDAWFIPGPNPGYHHEQQLKLLKDWPRLHDAVENLVNGLPPKPETGTMTGRFSADVSMMTEVARSQPVKATEQYRQDLLKAVNGVKGAMTGISVAIIFHAVIQLMLWSSR